MNERKTLPEHKKQGSKRFRVRQRMTVDIIRHVWAKNKQEAEEMEHKGEAEYAESCTIGHEVIDSYWPIAEHAPEGEQ